MDDIGFDCMATRFYNIQTSRSVKLLGYWLFGYWKIF